MAWFHWSWHRRGYICRLHHCLGDEVLARWDVVWSHSNSRSCLLLSGLNEVQHVGAYSDRANRYRKRPWPQCNKPCADLVWHPWRWYQRRQAFQFSGVTGMFLVTHVSTCRLMDDTVMLMNQWNHLSVAETSIYRQPTPAGLNLYLHPNPCLHGQAKWPWPSSYGSQWFVFGARGIFHGTAWLLLVVTTISDYTVRQPVILGRVAYIPWSAWHWNRMATRNHIFVLVTVYS